MARYGPKGSLGLLTEPSAKPPRICALRLRDVMEAKQSIAIFGGCYIGVVLPKFPMEANDSFAPSWDVPPQGCVNAGPCWRFFHRVSSAN